MIKRTAVLSSWLVLTLFMTADFAHAQRDESAASTSSSAEVKLAAATVTGFDDEQLAQWIKTASIPLTPKGEDFGPFDKHAGSARVIGLGEATHGQHEAFELKRQLTMHLIRRHGYRVVAYEASASSAVACNEYITQKSDNRGKAIAGLGMLVWQVEENGKLLDNLRAWNQQASPADQVRFIGCDAQDGESVMKRLERLLGDKNSDAIEQLNGFQKQLGVAMQQAMQGDKTLLEKLLADCLSKCQEVRQLAVNQSLDIAEVDVRLKEFVGNLGLYSAPGKRDKVMAELLLAQLDLTKPEEKCVFWGHNGHVQRGQLVLQGLSVPAMGGHLAKSLGDKYYAIGFDFGQGEFQANTRDENNKWRFRRYLHSAAPQGSMAALFAAATDTDFILDLRSAAKVPAVQNWLRSEQSFRSWGGYNVPKDFDDPKASPLPRCVPGETYDGIVFHHRTTAAQPLKSELILTQSTEATESQVGDPIASIPFRLTRWNNISVAAIVNDNFAVNLMFHTAADQVSLTHLTLENLPEITFDKEVEGESWGGNSSTRVASGIPVSIGPVELGMVGIFQSMHSGHQTDGKFGPRQLKSQFIEVAFDRSRILLHDSLPEKTSDWERLAITIEYGMMFVEGNIHHGQNVIPQRFMIHSGYSGFALLDDEFVAKHKYINDLEVINESELTDSGGNKLKTKKSLLPRFSIGAFQFEDVPVSFFDGAIGQRKFSVLGGEVLKRFNLVFDLENNALYLEKSRHFDSDSSSVTSHPSLTQTDSLVINPDVVLPKDVGESLVSALNGFLESAQKPNDENKFVLDAERLETFVLLDEFKEVEKNDDLKDDGFYKPYLTNVVAIEDKYLIQISYIGTKGSTSFLRASFELVAHPADDNSFLFSSPLVRNTMNWKVEKVGSNVFHFQVKINKENAQQYGELAALFDQKLNLKNKVTEFYCYENLRDIQKLIGVEYKADDNSESSGVYSSIIGDRKLVVLGNSNSSFETFDPHDLWHDRLSLAIARRKVNQPIDEGCAHLYGGCWGESWEKIFAVFKREIAADKNTDWLDCKFASRAFGEGYPRKFYVDHIANALLVKKIEREKGFEGVWQFLNCGHREKGDGNYFRVLEKLTGITKANYNDRIWELINSER